MESIPDAALLLPTRRLSAPERKVFDEIRGSFGHFGPSDAETLTQYAEATARYQHAAKETKKRPTVSIPVVNRSSGNVTGQKTVRNPMFATLREAQQQMSSLARRLLIDPASAEKRQRLLTKRARAFRAAEHLEAEAPTGHEFPEEDIEEMIQCLIDYDARIAPTERIRDVALAQLAMHEARQDPELAHLFSDRPHPRMEKH